MKRVTIINYGLSNLFSVKNAFTSFGVETVVSQRKEDVTDADVLILPGVGAFRDGMNGLSDLGLIKPITSKVREGVPLLGICLGMQMLFDESEEFGVYKGLGFIPGRVEKIPSIDINGSKQKIPHISWNPLYPSVNKDTFSGTLLEGITAGEECYFIHGYEAKPSYQENYLAITKYGGRDVCAVVQNKNVIGTQFHPEKSGYVGLKIIKSFIEKYC